MGIIVRCNWLPRSGASIDERVAEAVEAIQGLQDHPLVGADWLALGRSKRDALRRKVSLEILRARVKPWRRVPLIEKEAFWRLGLWNGRDSPEGGNLSITLFDPPVDPRTSPPGGLDSDQIVLSGPELDFLKASGLSWPDALDVARYLADKLGGVAIVTSNELWAILKDAGLSGSAVAAYAASWGEDRSGQNPVYARLPQSESRSVVVCGSWQEVEMPDLERVQQLAELLAPGPSRTPAKAQN